MKSSISIALAMLSLLFFSACAHRGTQNTAAGEAKPAKDIESFHLSDPEGPQVVDEELDNIPTEVNPLVEKWINYFQGKGHDHMERYLSRSARYEKLMKKVLRDNGLPEDLFYIAMIESGFSSKAVSHASAVGYWQFIRGTGKRYGLEINKFVDERRDPVLATQAAAEYFKGLYSVFGSWYLAMASYNAGENKVKREVMNNMTRDFWELARKRRLHRETINYIPKFIAAKMIAKDPAQYGFGDVDYMPPIEYDSVTVKQAVNLRIMAEKMNINYEDFKALNPKFKGEIAPLKGDSLDLRIPVGQRDLALAAAQDSAASQIEYIADSGDTQMYRIRKGESLYSIARKFRTTVAYLRDLNDIPKGKKLRVGMKLYVPDRTPVKERRGRTSNVASANKEAPAAVAKSEDSKTMENMSSDDASARFYIVQSGDSLFTIAKKYNTTVEELSKLNKIRRGRLLKVGVKLKLPADEAASPQESQKEEKSSLNSSSKRMKLAKHFAASTKSKRKPAGRRVVKHVVRPGENLYQIADKYNVQVAAIKAKNKIKNPSRLFVGARLIIPVAHASY